MYHPTTRLLTMLELLQARERLSGADLAARLEVDRRSIRRYIVMLQDLGIPIESIRGPAGGYRLRPGFKLPPLMFTDDEAVALTLALLLLPQSGLVVAPEAVEGARAKLERVLPIPLRAKVRALQEAIAVDQSPVASVVDGALIALLGEGARAGRRVHFRYRAAGGAETERDVDPYGLVNLGRPWYLTGWCHLRDGLGAFRLDRISDARPLDDAFAPPSGFDPVEAVLRSLAAAPGVWTCAVVLDCDLATARRRIPPTYGALEEASPGVLLRCRLDDLDDFSRYLIGLNIPFTILHPPELRIAIRRLGEMLIARDGA